jgi:alpha-beta hydrolase superfamily lysophospholipase
MLQAQPVYFGQPSRPLYGWYHAPVASAGRAVVLCNPLGLDATRAHWTYRHLAERLAGAGFDVLRFDWSGTGDSSGDGSGPDQVADWIDDLGQAIEELKARAGAPGVHLVGLRAGASLAAHVAAARDDVDSTVLWMPAMTGAAWVTEMAKLHKLYLRIVPQADAPEPGGEEMLGSFASASTIADLARIDLLALPRRPSPRVLVVEEGTLREGERLRERLAALGADVSWTRQPAQKFLLMVPHRATLPEESIEAIVHWLRSLPASAAPVRPGRSTAPVTFGERPVRFGPERRLFGILTPAAKAPPGDRPAIVLLPAGAVNRCGPHRLYVTMARRWADLGFTVFRIDLSGIGDSPAPPGERENLVYPRPGLEDIGAALDFLSAEAGAARFIIAGLCSGADLAYQAARREERLVGVVMMNPRTFLDLDLNRVEQPPPRVPRESEPVETEEARRVPAGLRQISERGMDAFLLVSERDPGIDYVDRHASAAMRDAQALPRFRRVDIRGTDHTFTSIASQRRVIDLVTNEYLSRYR